MKQHSPHADSTDKQSQYIGRQQEYPVTMVVNTTLCMGTPVGL